MSLELKRLPADSSLNEIFSIIQDDGGVILSGFISAQEVEQLNKDFDQPVIETGPGSKKTDDLESIKEFHGYQTTRVNNLTTHSKLFREVVLEKDIIHELGEAFFRKESGDWWLMATQLIQIGPGNKSQRLHRDLENFPAFIELGPSGPCVTANFMIALTDFTEENGATRLIPGSHKWDNFKMSPEDRLKHEDTIPALMKAGDMLIWDGKLIHSGGENKTENEYRRGIALPITPAYFTPEESYAFSIDLNVIKTLSPRVQKILGFRSVFPNTGNGLWQHNFEKLEEYLGLDA
ncbi:phytanoyl-CoA dioxygenase family protein [Acinetobacter baumannii]|uniref:phytanoyl-CoA dioxygenase family protein n=1 Tax=Acinetobacter baumannii TaxID=470 RepID=UPI0024469D30|nr:phytanoyl-CoA dioxygenase family protein [Acinetobacter baumannii]MDH2528294.1 phytanoyl-CoA dioxygenase family protein [Acinetobacter baumannii]